jgi:hypothetical protein
MAGLLQALLEAEARGDTWRDHGLSPAPHFLHEDGTVKVPRAQLTLLFTLQSCRPAHSAGLANYLVYSSMCKHCR